MKIVNKLPFYSFIVPVYNVENYLEDCLNSLLSQNYRNFEIILVDDGATDNSGKICDKYAKENDSIIRVVHKKNGGLSSARNVGINYSKGDYILFIDGDDTIIGTTLTIITRAISQYDDIDIVLSNGLIKEKVNKLSSKTPYDCKKIQGCSGIEALLYTSKYGANWSACGKAFKKSFWTEHGYRFCEGRNWEDFQLIDRVMIDAKKVCMVSPFYIYRIREGSITHTVSYEDILDLLESIKDWNKYMITYNVAEYDELQKCLWGLQAYVLSRNIMGYSFLIKDKNILVDSEKYKFLLKYDKTMNGRIVYIMTQIVGYKLTCKLLSTKKRMLHG